MRKDPLGNVPPVIAAAFNGADGVIPEGPDGNIAGPAKARKSSVPADYVPFWEGGIGAGLDASAKSVSSGECLESADCRHGEQGPLFFGN